MKLTPRTYAIVAAIYVSAVILIVNEFVGLHVPPPYNKLLTEIGVALVAVGTIHLLDHLALIRETATSIEERSRELFAAEIKTVAAAIVSDVAQRSEGALSKATQTLTTDIQRGVRIASDSIVTDVTSRTDVALQGASERLLGSVEEASHTLQRQVKAINVMEQIHLGSIYESRSAAAESIRTAMRDSKRVRLMGISLNEFFRADQNSFQEAWNDLVRSLRRGEKTAEILLIDPYCNGAILRSYSERAGVETSPGRLENDVLEATAYLQSLRSELAAQSNLPDGQSNLQVRLYSIAPTNFLCQLDTVTFAQPYHFWNARHAGNPIPVFVWKDPDNLDSKLCMHAEMGHHFDFIWKHASSSLDEFVPTPSRGLEWGAHIAATSSVFVDTIRPNFRMRDEIIQSKRIWIQGITLNHFINEPILYRAIKKKAHEDGVDIRVLLLDPDCSQAHERAYREFLLKNPRSQVSFENFARSQYSSSKLFRDLEDTLMRLEHLVHDPVQPLKTVAGEPGRHSQGSVQVRRYDTAPHMFVLIGDSSAFVEQYSYGKIEDPSHEMQDDVILGTDMPLLEYRKKNDLVYARVLADLRRRPDFNPRELRPQPYALLESHFAYAWSRAKQSEEIPLRKATGDLT